MSEITVAGLSARVAAAEGLLAGLTDAAAAAGVNSYAAPDDTALRQAADDAMAALREAQRELDRLRLALAFAERQETEQAAAAAEAIAQAERQKARDKLVREHESVADRYLKLESKIAADQAILDGAELEADVLAAQWRDVKLKIEVYRERVGNDTRRLNDLAGQHLTLKQQIAAAPVTVAEIAAAAEQAAAAQAAQAAANLKWFEADTARQIRETIENEVIDAPEPFEPERSPLGSLRAGRWQRSPNGKTIRIARKDLPAHEAQMAEAAAWYAEHGEPFEIVVAADRRYYSGPDGQITIIDGPVHLQRRLLPEFRAEQKRLAARVRKANRRRVVEPAEWTSGMEIAHEGMPVP